MRNVLVLGSGRSGTSMVAGSLAGAGWFVGARPYPPRSSNPKGFFESPDVNGVNELLLSEVVPASERMRDWQRWLAWLPDDADCRSSARAERVLRRLTAQQPWCFKDPRLCYTLPVWRPHIGGAGLVCVFRDPAVTVRSILKECEQEDYLARLAMDFERGLAAWTAMYRRILDRHRASGDWLFLHYEQALTREGLERLERFVDGPVSREFPEERLRRTRSDEPVPAETARVYEELCELAGHAAARRAVSASCPERRAERAPVFSRAVEVLGRSASPILAQARSARTLDEFERCVRSVAPDGGAPAADLEYVDARLPRIALWERTVRELGALDLGDLEALGAEAAIRALVGEVAAALRELAEVYVREERVARAEAELAGPWPIESNAKRRVLAWPRWDVDSLRALLERFGPALSVPGAPALCLRFDAERDVDWEAALRALQEAYEAALPERPALEVVVLDEPIRTADLARLGASVDAVLQPLGDEDGERLAWLTACGAPFANSGDEFGRSLRVA